ncbi:MAG: ArgE/DapE family deacylase [Anaerolineales bacterium]|jgi:acetylornithine deacetylase
MTDTGLQIDRDYLVATLQALVRINSINPTLVPGAPGEAEIGAYIAAKYEKLGLQVRIDELEPARFNVTGMLPGTGGGRSLLLNAHMDTVGVEGMSIEPFDPVIRDGRLYGRGAQDMKASLAAMMATAKALSEAGIRLRGDLILAAVADEEHSSIGTEALVRTLHADGAIVTEPTDLAICRAHRGFQWYEIETYGRAAHGSRYQEGIDANLHMGRVLAELDVLAKELVNRDPHPLMGPPSLNAALLNGGTEASIYADRCLLQMERRTIAGESQAGTQAELQAILDRQAAKDPQFRAELRFIFERTPFEVAAEAPIVTAVDRAAAGVLAKPPTHSGQTFWTDAALHADAGTETVLIGPIGAGLHSAEEWVDIDSAVQLAEILARAAIEYCGVA